MTRRTPSACRRSIDAGCKSVAVAQPLGKEVRDVGAEQFERATQDHGRCDAVDVVVSVDRDALLVGDGAAECDRRRPADRSGRLGSSRSSSDGDRKRRALSGSSRPRMHSSRAVTGDTRSSCDSCVTALSSQRSDSQMRSAFGKSRRSPSRATLS